MTRAIAVRGRVLHLAADRRELEAQLAGVDLPYDASRALVDDVSTDELTPAWTCYWYDDELARWCLVGLRSGVIGRDMVRDGGFEVLVAGRSFGCGSSRETAPFALKEAGIQIIVARSFEKIFRQNCENLGILLTTDFTLLERVAAGEELSLDLFTAGLDEVGRQVVERGGLFAHARARLRGRVVVPPVTTEARPMTIVEKIIAAHVVLDPRDEAVGVPAVRPGDSAFVRADVRFSHDYVTAMADAQFRRGFGEGARVVEPETVWAFRDHLNLLDRVMPRGQRALGLDVQARKLADVQRAFAERHGIRFYDEERDGAAHGICHAVMLEEIALPGDVVIGTDSHTCTAGAIGAFAFGVGATDMANAWRTRDVRVRVPGSVRVWMHGRPAVGVCAKDVALALLASPLVREGGVIGRALVFDGPGMRAMSIDERATLTNMAVEAGAFTGIVEPEETIADEMAREGVLDVRLVRDMLVRSDDDAQWEAVIDCDLSAVEPMVATPGDPRNGRPLREILPSNVHVDIAYGGSCTGGKRADMDMYAAVLAGALARGRRVADGTRLYIQFGSHAVRLYAEQRGYLDLFRAVGAELVEPSCGACIRAGPGVSEREDQITVSAINRNFPGRSGPGQVYLASPLVVAASAIAGRLASPEHSHSPI